MPAYYNEIDENAVSWLRELMKQDLIAPGDIDNRPIQEVTPDDLEGYTQCHFFAGIGVWSYALRQAGWPDDREVWTGSCPCQPFSSAGKQGGFDDERHLWPYWKPLILVREPATVFGEQVASAAGRAWFDLVSTDLEDMGYAAGAADLCAAGVGAPHIRQRLWWVADITSGRQRIDGGAPWPPGYLDERSASQRLADHDEDRCSLFGAARLHDRRQSGDDAVGCGAPDWPGDGGISGLEVTPRDGGMARVALSRDARQSLERAGATRGAWADADWLLCTDGACRPVEPGTFPLAHGASARVGRLRGYGNAIVAPLAETFIAAVMEVV